jgi:transcriptional regulator with XRE-family HTH domain
MEVIMKTTGFAKAISERLEAKGWDIAELAQQIDSSYEFVRQLVRGYTLPGKHLLKDICKVLELDHEAMSRLVISDKITKKYGQVPLEMAHKEPRFLEIERLLPQLTPEQFEIVVGIIEGITRRNRRSEADAISSQPKQKVFKMFSPPKAKLEKAKVTK